eukprot:366414-Chlamydomonas_euryale.AAC.8
MDPLARDPSSNLAKLSFPLFTAPTQSHPGSHSTHSAPTLHARCSAASLTRCCVTASVLSTSMPHTNAGPTHSATSHLSSALQRGLVDPLLRHCQRLEHLRAHRR